MLTKAQSLMNTEIVKVRRELEAVKDKLVPIENDRDKLQTLLNAYERHLAFLRNEDAE